MSIKRVDFGGTQVERRLPFRFVSQLAERQCGVNQLLSSRRQPDHNGASIIAVRLPLYQALRAQPVHLPCHGGRWGKALLHRPACRIRSAHPRTSG